MKTILVTGSMGLIGSRLISLLQSEGYNTQNFDNRLPHHHHHYGDLLSYEYLKEIVDQCDGVVHLAGISRVVWGQHQPVQCWDTNFRATLNLINIIQESKKKPWMIYASSREVYGQQDILPVKEDAKLQPMNIYAESKVAAENVILEARHQGLKTAVIRYSSVYGGTNDHLDRVMPAFCMAAINKDTMNIEGADNVLDFTYVDDVVRGTYSMIQLLNQSNDLPPPIHLTSGIGTSLESLAKLVMEISGYQCKIEEKAPRSYDVSRFCGDPSRAKSILGWEATTTLEQGIANFISDLKEDRI